MSALAATVGALIGALLALAPCATAAAQAPGDAERGVVIPHYWDARQRPDQVELRGPRVIRFLVDDDYPPFHYLDPEGRLIGFSVDLARALCAELRAACTVQARRWDTLLESLAEGRGDAIIAALRMTAEIKARFLVTQPYHRSPARFVARLGVGLPAPTPASLKGRKVAVATGSAHAAFLEAFFAGAELLREADAAAALRRLREGGAEFAFGDGVTLALWLNGEESASCCAFRGGPYLEPRYFGEGVGVIVRREQPDLLRALDQTLALIADRGIYGELYLKHFPVSFY